MHLFHRDLRLVDNTALIRAHAECEEVVPVFIFDPQQTKKNNPYFSEHAFAFMVHSLAELDATLRARGDILHIFNGDPNTILTHLINVDTIDAVYTNGDYTPFARARDETLARTCTKHHVPYTVCEDVALAPVKTIATKTGTPYSVFTPFLRTAMQHTVATPHKGTRARYVHELNTPSASIPPVSNVTPHAPGRRAGLALLTDSTYMNTYNTARNLPALSGTSRLSSHHKFGTISIRETYHMARTHTGDSAQQFIAELYWRDFYYHIAYHFPRVFGNSFLPWGDRIAWQNDPAGILAWKRGETGIPLVDAGMRELNETGWMHNRVRMVVASFLTKNMLVDWREGEKYFATQLVDYDPAVNNGGWQWSASVGADPRPLRIFNPYTQAQKYDPRADYIQRWVPELLKVPHNLLTDGKERDFSRLCPCYPAPIVSCRETYHRAREVYAQAKQVQRKSIASTTHGSIR